MAAKSPNGGSPRGVQKKADKQDGGHCRACQERMVQYGSEFRDRKTAELGASEMAAEAAETAEAAEGKDAAIIFIVTNLL